MDWKLLAHNLEGVEGLGSTVIFFCILSYDVREDQFFANLTYVTL